MSLHGPRQHPVIAAIVGVIIFVLTWLYLEHLK